LKQRRNPALFAGLPEFATGNWRRTQSGEPHPQVSGKNTGNLSVKEGHKAHHELGIHTSQIHISDKADAPTG
jgi:hypothetical protein